MPKPVACSEDVAEVEEAGGTSHSNPSKRRMGEPLLIGGLAFADAVLALCSCPFYL